MFSKVWIVLLSFLLLTFHIYAWPEPLVPREYVLASNYFGFNVFHQKGLENDHQVNKENIFLSPFSISTVLAMLQQGANGETYQQLNSVLGLQLAMLGKEKSLVAKKVQEAMKRLTMFENGDGNISLTMANAIIISKNFPINDNYTKTIQQYFESELIPADFVNEYQLMMDAINQWCSAKTNGKITQFLQNPPSQSTQLALINAIYFKGNWKNRFLMNQTADGVFYGPNNETFENVSFMRRQGRLVTAYLAELESDLIELPYEGDEVSMFVLLPRDQSKYQTISYIRKALNPWYIESALSRLNEENEATIIFPKLKIMGNYDLKETLKDLGLVNIFDYAKTNLTDISPDPPIVVDEVRHAAVIDINEDGTEAAASTYVGFVKMSLQTSSIYYVNRPFVMFIRYNPNGQILFLGEINHP